MLINFNFCGHPEFGWVGSGQEKWTRMDMAAMMSHNSVACISIAYSMHYTLFDWNLILKIVFETTFGDLMVMYILTPSIARIGKPWSTLFVIIEFFAISYGLETSGNLSKSVFFEGGWVSLSANFRRNGRRPPTTVGVRKLQRLPFRVVSKYLQCIVWFCQARVIACDRQTDGQTDRITAPKTVWCVAR